MINKISVIGAGRVGESTALMLAIKQLAQNIVLIDLDDKYVKGVALDIQQTAAIYNFDSKLVGSSDIKNIVDSTIVIITAGFPRKPGMDRADVLAANIAVIDKVLEGVLKYAPQSFVIIVTNPVDVLTYYACKKTKWPRNRIIGQAGILDSARMASFIADSTNFSIDDIQALVLGGHGDTMVPLPRLTTVSGVSIEHLLDKQSIENIIKRTRNGGAEILNLKRTSSAYNAPGAAVIVMVDAIVYDKSRLLPCIGLLQGEYGESDLAIGVPVVLNKNGIERIIELELTSQEQKLFASSVKITRNLINSIKI